MTRASDLAPRKPCCVSPSCSCAPCDACDAFTSAADGLCRECYLLKDAVRAREVDAYLAAMMLANEGHLDAAWRKLWPAEQAEVARRLQGGGRR